MNSKESHQGQGYMLCWVLGAGNRRNQVASEAASRRIPGELMSICPDVHCVDGLGSDVEGPRGATGTVVSWLFS